MRHRLLSILSVLTVTLGLTIAPAHAGTITQGRLSLTSDQTRVQPGTTVTLSGELDGYDGTHWAPLPGETVTLKMLTQVNGWVNIKALTTDSAGDFQAKVTVQHDTQFIPQTSSFMAYWAGPTGSANGTYSPQASVDVPWPVTVPVSKFSYDANGNLTISGRISTPDNAVGFTVNAEFSPNGKAPWKVVKTTNGVSTYSDYGFLFFYGQSGYWRIHVLSDADHWDGYSSVYKAWRWSTKITGFKVTPTKIRRGGSITISGTLLGYQRGAFRGLARQWVYIDYRIPGQNSYWLTKVRTDANGNFRTIIKNIGSTAYWTIDFRGATGYFATWPGKWIRVAA